jgi:enamine deaminase RidA (YjgF/YER057c/UK114 family)
VGQRRPCHKRPSQATLEIGTMLRRITPAAICPPLASYSRAVEVPPNARWLYVSGQLGIAPDGTVPASCVEQAEACFANLLAILADAGMGTDDLVRLNTYLTDPDDRADYMAVRDRHVTGRPPASTLLVVRALARPEFKIEIEAVAAQVGRQDRYSPARRGRR